VKNIGNAVLTIFKVASEIEKRGRK
jgi:hypothetical protein